MLDLFRRRCPLRHVQRDVTLFHSHRTPPNRSEPGPNRTEPVRSYTTDCPTLTPLYRYVQSDTPRCSTPCVSSQGKSQCLATAKRSWIHDLVRRLVRRVVRAMGVSSSWYGTSNTHTGHMQTPNDHTHTSVHTPRPQKRHFSQSGHDHGSMI